MTNTSERVLGFSDIDGTITPGFTWIPICNAFADVDFISHDDLKRIQETKDDYDGKVIEYPELIKNSFTLVAKALAGRRASVATALTAEFVTSDVPIYGWVDETFATIKKLGGKATLVSAAPHFIAEAIGSKIGIADSYSSIFKRDAEGNFTGEVEVILGATQKGQIVSRQKQAEPNTRICVFGDSEGDMGMLSEASPSELGFCINPTQGLREFAVETGMTIVDDPNIPRSLI